jgi:hypothetical protein
MYDVLSATLVWVNTGLPTAEVADVVASPPPHCVEQPGDVGLTVAVFDTSPAATTAPVTVKVADWPAARFVTVPATLLALEPDVSQVEGAVAKHVTELTATVDGTVSLTLALPGPVPVFETVIM